MTKPTCGVLYKQALDAYTSSDAEVRIFAAGFVSGQAEKVYLGACRAAMFRPSETRQPIILEVAADVARRYDLLLAIYGPEIWLCRDKQAQESVYEMARRTKDSPGWHRLRAHLCGVPAGEVDEEFHLRSGYGE